ncbi:unnamed protein product [Taenia asiatica]|uniref:Calponin-homology (CH) domain-containing protein n=1 Tax=Taenia asiatica TaxID=60517 RepID=A0A0R3W3M3_TAEAS|nr:unnamed protein product [Taenia asiatica]
MNTKYNPEVEKEVLDWIRQLTGANIEQGREKVAAALRDGEILIKLVNVIYEGTAELPSSAANLRRPFKASTSKISFKMCQRHNFNGPKCGPRPTYENKRTFSPEQLAMSNTVIGLQAGFNKGASQKGMSMGAVRHIADIKADDMTREGQSIIGLQAGSNKGASQKGMSMGAVRHIADMKIDPMSADGKTVIGLQAGSNKGASQSGMSIGGIRHIADIKTDNISEAGKQVIGLQAGTNKVANQSGMSMGGIRHIADLKVGAISDDGKSVIGLQAGSNAGATQAGMSFGGRRDITKPT